MRIGMLNHELGISGGVCLGNEEYPLVNRPDNLWIILVIPGHTEARARAISPYPVHLPLG